MKTNRSLLVLILLSILTLGIYSLFFWSAYSRDMNTVCQGDGKHTRGLLARFFFNLITFGIYDLFWHYGVGERIGENAMRRGIHVRTSGTNVLLWLIFGSLMIIGPLVVAYKLIDGLNQLSAHYNAEGSGQFGRSNAGSPTINIYNTPN